MLLTDYNDAAVWQGWWAYDTGTRIIHYERPLIDLPCFGDDFRAMIGLLNLAPASRIVLIGAAFGFYAEGLAPAGHDVVCVDLSTWIHANKAGNAVLPILDADVRRSDDRADICVRLGGAPDVVISEDCLVLYDNAGALEIAEGMRAFGGRVVHWITLMENDPDHYNCNTGPQWKELLGPDEIVLRGTGELL